MLISDLNLSLYQIRVFGQLGIITGLMGVLYAVHFRVIGTNKLEFGSLFPLFTMLAVSFWGAGQLAEPHYSQHLDYCRERIAEGNK